MRKVDIMKKAFWSLLLPLLLLELSAGQVNYAKNMRTAHGEIMPELPNENLLKNGDFSKGLSGWKMLGKGKATVIQDGKFPSVKLSGSGSVFALVSEPFMLEAGKVYYFTGVYNTRNAKFGSGCEIMFIPDEKVDTLVNKYGVPGQFSGLHRRVVVNRLPGEYFRKTLEFKPTAKTSGKYRAAVVVSGAPFDLLWSGLYAGVAPAKDSRSGLFRENIEKLDPKTPPEKLKEILDSRSNAYGEIRFTENGYAQIFINGKVVPSKIFFGDSFEPYRSKRQMFQKAGIELQIIRLRYNNNLWVGDKKIDFAKIDSIIYDSVARNPHGYYIIGIDVTPYPHWAKDFPDDAECDINGKYVKTRGGFKAPPSYWSANYRQKALEYLTAVIEHMKQQPYWKTVVGIFPHGNNDGQFFYQGTRTGSGTLQDGHAKSARKMFQEFLKKEYGTVENLRKAWNDPGISFETAASPVTNQKLKSRFLDYRTEKRYVDFVRFLNESFCEFANELGMTAKRVAGKKVFTVMWFDRGGSPRVQPYYSMAEKMLPGRGVDAFAAQTGYHDSREAGLIPAFTWCFDSDRIHGKLMIEELDYRTRISGYKSLKHDFHVARFSTLKYLKDASLRQIGNLYAVGGGVWWFPLTSGWYMDEGIMGVIKKLQDIARVLSEKKASFTPADSVVITDEKSYYRTVEQVNVWNGPNFQTVCNNQQALQRAGVKYDFYYLKDVVDRNMSDYKLYIFLNLYKVGPETGKFIERLKKSGKTILFIYASGYQTDSGLSVENMAEITGIKFAGADKGLKSSRFVKSGHPLSEKLRGEAGIGVDLLGPRFLPDDPEATVLARYRKGGKPSVVVKKVGNSTVVYSGVTAVLTPQFVQNLVKYSGGHIYNKTPGDMFTYHRDDMVVLHGVEGNENHLDFPGNVEFYDMFDEKTVDGKSLRIAPGETKLLLIRNKK